MRTLLKISFMLTLVAFLASCGGGESKAVEAGDAEKAAEATTASRTYNVTEGTVYWAGSKITGKTHNGTININAGEITADGDKITSGTFTIDMNSITNLDMAGNEKMKAKLEGHLKSADFFDVEKFPTASFAVTSVAPATGEDVNYNITGNLTMKGITKSITFPAMVLVVGDKVSATAPKFTINRADWEVKYGSGRFFENLGDNLINDDVSLNISLTATAPAM